MKERNNIHMMQIFTLNQSKILKNKKGFSLLELLISVSLLGLVMALIYGSFFQISKFSTTIKSDLNSREQLRLLMKIVLDDLQNVKYLKNFPISEKKLTPHRDTGIIAERIIDSEQSAKKGELGEFSIINFHSAIKSRFYQEKKESDPGIHEIGYSLEKDPNSKTWNFLRREDFYLDNNLKEGGKTQIISRSVINFDLELLESETKLAGGGFVEKWTKKWNSEENKCNNSNIKGNFCLPRAIKLTMALKGNDKRIVSDSQVVNLCIPPCNPEIFH